MVENKKEEDNLKIAWNPTPDYVENARLTHFMGAHNLHTYEELLAWAAEDVGRFWDAVVKDLDFQFYTPYTAPLDLSNGIEWATWFSGSKLNYVHNALDKHALGETGDKVALIAETEEGTVRCFTYAELLQEVNRCANALRELGLQKGERLGIFLPMIPEAVVAVLACAKLGAIFIPIFSGYAAQSATVRLQDAGAKIVITADGFYRRGKIVSLKASTEEAVNLTPSVEHVLVVRRIGALDPSYQPPWNPRRDIWYDEIVPRQSAEFETVQTEAEDPYMIIYTSGTTGRPKGALHTHDGFPLKSAQDMAYCFDVKPADTLFWFTDMGWMMGPWAVAGTLILGATLFIYEGTPDYPAPDRLWEMVERHQITILGIAPTLVRALMTHEESWVERHNLESLRILGSSGEPWNPGPWEWFFQKVGGGRCPIINYSGGTEISGGIIACNPLLPIKPTSFSGPVPGMIADVVDEFGQPLRGSVGELVIRAPWVGMTRGFWGDQQRYIDAYWSRFPGLWVHGDWARIDDEGFWFIQGRSDDTIKVAGKRLGPAEVESAAVSHPAVAEAAAIGVPDEIKGDVVVCFVVLKKGLSEDEKTRKEIEETITGQLGKALKPDRVLFVGELPKTRNAKIMRRVIKSKYLGGEPGDISALENPGAVEEIGRAR